MEKVREYGFKVTMIREGQPRKYADSEYEIETTEGEYVTEKFCHAVLHSCGQTQEKFRSDEGNYFMGYFTFKKTAKNKYRYFVMIPFCD